LFYNYPYARTFFEIIRSLCQCLVLDFAQGNQVWLGGSDAATEGQWRWYSSTQLWGFTNWDTRKSPEVLLYTCVGLQSAKVTQNYDFLRQTPLVRHAEVPWRNTPKCEFRHDSSMKYKYFQIAKFLHISHDGIIVICLSPPLEQCIHDKTFFDPNSRLHI
jgi:hypothetical protein